MESFDFMGKEIYSFSGIEGIKDLYIYLTKQWKPKDSYSIVSAPLQSFKLLEAFFLKTVHAKRINDRVMLKMIVNANAESYGLVRKKMPFSEVKFLNIDTTVEYGVLNDMLFIVDYGKNPYGVLIKDQNLANTFELYFNIMWQTGRKLVIPPMIKMNTTIQNILSKYKQRNPFIVVDSYNIQAVKKTGLPYFFIKNNKYSNVHLIKKQLVKNKSKVIFGIGGCTTLDAARASSTADVPCILMPTILSTVCISVNKAVLNDNGVVKTFTTEIPQKIIVSMPTILESKKEDIAHWGQAGFGDLFAKVGAAIDVVYRDSLKNKDVLSLDKVRRRIPEVFDAIEYVLEHFNNYSKKDLEALAVFLHEASVSIIIRDTFELSGGAEHNLAYAIEKEYFTSKAVKPEHGIIVSIGTLIELRIFSEFVGDTILYDKMRLIYQKIGLPTTYEGLAKIGVTKKQLQYGLKKIKNYKTFMSVNYKQAAKLLDEIFK